MLYFLELTKERGFQIREEYSTIKEKQICDAHHLTQVGGSKTKIDGQNETERKSIKNASGSSTQVHLTTQKSFIQKFNLNDDAVQFIRLFCGGPEMNINGKDRYSIRQIDVQYTNAFAEFLKENTENIVNYIVCNGDDITHVIYNDLKNQKEYELTYSQILDRIRHAEWYFLNGGIHLKLNKKTLFHFQREGKKKPSQRYNVLWHIHKNLFLV